MTLENAARTAMCDALCALFDGGDMKFETAAHNEVSINDFAATAFGGAVNGVATAGTIADDTSTLAGTIAHCHLRTSDGTPLAQLTCTVTGGGGEVVFPSLVFGAGDTLQVTGGTITVPAS